MNLESWVVDKVQQYVSTTTQRLVIAFSGGVDSSVLLQICALQQAKLSLPIEAIYINHGLSPNADDWQQHCANVCALLNVPFSAHRVVITDIKKGIESAAREARYSKLAEITSEKDIILLGQHSDDQVETFLLQLLRGSGPDGLMAMPEFKIDPYNRCYLRPLLGIAREDIEDYAHGKQLQWIEDESNASTVFDRNYLRHDVLPVLKKRFPSASQSILRAISHLQEQSALLSEITKQKYLECLDDSGKLLCIERLQSFSYGWQKQIIKCWIREQGYLQPSSAVLAQTVQQCLAAAVDATPIVTWEDVECRRFNGCLYLLKQQAPPADFDGTFDADSLLSLPNGLGQLQIASAKIGQVAYRVTQLTFPLQVRFSGYGVRFTPYGATHSKPLKQWFKQWRIPPWKRAQCPLIFSGDELLQVGDNMSAVADIADGSSDWVTIHWQK